MEAPTPQNGKKESTESIGSPSLKSTVVSALFVLNLSSLKGIDMNKHLLSFVQNILCAFICLRFGVCVWFKKMTKLHRTGQVAKDVTMGAWFP